MYLTHKNVLSQDRKYLEEFRREHLENYPREIPNISTELALNRPGPTVPRDRGPQGSECDHISRGMQTKLLRTEFSKYHSRERNAYYRKRE